MHCHSLSLPDSPCSRVTANLMFPVKRCNQQYASHNLLLSSRPILHFRKDEQRGIRSLVGAQTVAICIRADVEGVKE